MGQLISDLPKNYSNKIVTIQTIPRARVFVDADGTNTVVLPVDDAKNEGMYYIEAPGADTYYFYTNLLGLETFKLLGFGFCCDEAVESSAQLQAYVDGTYRNKPAFVSPYGGGNFSTTESNYWNECYPLEQGVFGMPMRVAITVTGITTIYLQGYEG